MLYAQIAIPRPLHHTLTYRVLEGLEKSIQPGQRVLVPFRNRTQVGFVLGITNQAPANLDPAKIKPIQEILDLEPVFSQELLNLLNWMTKYYYAAIGEVCKAALPNRLTKIETPKSGRTGLPAELEIIPEPEAKFTLTKDQLAALDIILNNLKTSQPKPLLLHGITGSGKTEVYLRAFEQVKKEGGNGILLVPEISLTPQLIQRFRQKFGEEIAIYHSALTDAQRFAQWKKIKSGAVFAVVGTRSALFAPFDNLHLIVIDEEHDSSYKQEDGFLYNARDCAIVRANLSGATIVLGSATPSMESFTNVQKEKYDYFYLASRATGANLPGIEIVDMRAQENFSLSQTLLTAIEKRLAQKEQTLIFLNRRGFASFLICQKCGETIECPNCDITLTNHQSPARLICHYCEYQVKPPEICPACQGAKLKALGHGTQKIEDELAKHFPEAKIARLDKDSTAKVGMRKSFLSKMQKGEIDILVGTQIITKGHDFPNVTLVGVIDADISLNLPDFRAFERTFQILTQVSGRSGRAQKPGEVIIQTYQPDHPSIIFAKEHNFENFYETEKMHRETLKYPPFVRIAGLKFSGNSKDLTQKTAQQCLKKLSQTSNNLNLNKVIEILGPAPAPIPKVRGKYRFRLMIKASTSSHLANLLNSTLPEVRNNIPAGCKMIVDVDPINML
ncbi:MAG: primosomal protein N' [Pseudomonadota bacterium]